MRGKTQKEAGSHGEREATKPVREGVQAISRQSRGWIGATLTVRLKGKARAVERMAGRRSGAPNAVKAVWDEVGSGWRRKTGVWRVANSLVGSAAAPVAAGLPSPKSQAEYDRLPPGSRYIGTDGKRK